jgi:glycosyltransferase involved in cell wall biosynthesis
MHSMNSVSEYKPLVSIALTTFNGASLIKEQVDSLLAQTYQNFEIVISDDGSEQETIDILNAYVAQDNRISWSRSPLERGYRKNTENAITLCKGEIIFLCDQDDTWYKDRLALHVEAYKDPSVMWVFNRLVITDSVNNPTGYIEDTLPDYYRHKTVLENVWGTCIGGAMTSYRAELVKKVMPIPSYAPAHDSWIQLAIYPAKSVFIDKVLQTYRQHDRNQVGIKAKPDKEALQKLEQQAIADNYLRLLRYASEKHLELWKRGFLLSVYLLKKVRYIIRRLIGRTDSKLG